LDVEANVFGAGRSGPKYRVLIVSDQKPIKTIKNPIVIGTNQKAIKMLIGLIGSDQSAVDDLTEVHVSM
jgi:hypothetical protein